MTGPIHLTTGVWSFTPPRVTEKKDSRQPDSEKRCVGGREVKSDTWHTRNSTALQAMKRYGIHTRALLKAALVMMTQASLSGKFS